MRRTGPTSSCTGFSPSGASRDPVGTSIPWTRLVYLVHRWIGTVLGVAVFVWFASGIAMLYYPWPLLKESRELGILTPFEPDSTLVGFRQEFPDRLINVGIAEQNLVGIGAGLANGGPEDAPLEPGQAVFRAISARVINMPFVDPLGLCSPG